MSSVAVRLFKFEREYTPKRDTYAQGHDRYHIAGNLGSEIETVPVGEYYCSNTGKSTRGRLLRQRRLIEDKIMWCVPAGAHPQSLVTVVDPGSNSHVPIQRLSVVCPSPPHCSNLNNGHRSFWIVVFLSLFGAGRGGEVGKCYRVLSPCFQQSSLQ